MQLRLLYFGIARDATGLRQDKITLNGSVTVGGLRNILREQNPGLGAMPDYAVAVNCEYATDDRQLREDDEVAVIPPVSGG